jgi:hypothetical protein
MPSATDEIGVVVDIQTEPRRSAPIASDDNCVYWDGEADGRPVAVFKAPWVS